MKTLSIDVETFSPVTLGKTGVYPYAAHPDFEVLLFAYSIDHGPVEVVDLALGEQIPAEILAALEDPEVTKWAFNAQFERVCLSAHLGRLLDPQGWKCTMVWAAAMGLPLSLDGVARTLKLPQQKLSTGKALIRRFCAPVRPSKANGMKKRNRAEDDPQRWAQFVEYNIRDVDVELGIQNRLQKNPLREEDWEDYWLDQRINDRGILVDQALVDGAVQTSDAHRQTVMTAAKKTTGLENPNSVTQLTGWLHEQGCDIPSLAKADVEQALTDATGKVREALLQRVELSKSSVRKYQAMSKVAGSDGRARGLFQFLGAGRTGRWAGRLIQLQNLPRNYISDLDVARDLVRSGNGDLLNVLYDSLPDTLSQLVRTAFIPAPEKKFVVADYSAIEARVIAWLAGEQWVLDLFTEGGDIYCATGTRMFKEEVTKGSPLRQKSKVAVLACVAEGQPVLTDQGLVPIEEVTTDHLVWDGYNWVHHEGLLFKGVRDVIEYHGLTATTDHLVWVEGQQGPIPLGEAAANGARLVQTGDDRTALRLGRDHLFGEALVENVEPLLRPNTLHGVRVHAMAEPQQPNARTVEGLPSVLPTSDASALARPQTHSSEATVREPERPRLQRLRSARNRVQVSLSDGGRTIPAGDTPEPEPRLGDRQDQQQRPLRSGEHPSCYKGREYEQHTQRGADSLGAEVLAVCAKCGDSETIGRDVPRRGHWGRPASGCRATEELANDRGKVRVYDLLNAGPHHRFTVSGRLVHNCGYGGSVGALKAMGALEQGLDEGELQPLVNAWRSANPRIVSLWNSVDSAAKHAVQHGAASSVLGKIKFHVESGLLFITLPSGRRLAYVSPRIGQNRFGGESVTYLGTGLTRRWERIETFGGKLVENIVQAVARDLLADAMMRLEDAGHQIVMHVHDEVVIEAPTQTTVREVCDLMAQTPSWANGLPMAAEGFETLFYQKD